MNSPNQLLKVGGYRYNDGPMSYNDTVKIYIYIYVLKSSKTIMSLSMSSPYMFVYVFQKQSIPHSCLSPISYGPKPHWNIFRVGPNNNGLSKSMGLICHCYNNFLLLIRNEFSSSNGPKSQTSTFYFTHTVNINSQIYTQ